jgi:hypothetical protein
MRRFVGGSIVGNGSPNQTPVRMQTTLRFVCTAQLYRYVSVIPCSYPTANRNVMKINRLIIFILLLIFFLPKEAFLSGMVSRKGISNFVYIEKSVGMKFHRGSQEMIDSAYKSNHNRLNILQKEVDSLAKQIESTIIDFAKSSKDTFEFSQIENGYVLYKKGAYGYSSSPTLFSNEEAKEHLGKKCYFLLLESPVVVVSFLKLPNLEQLDLLRTSVRKTINNN